MWPPASRRCSGQDTSIVTAMNGVPWWFFDRLKFGGGKQRLESLDPGGSAVARHADRAHRRLRDPPRRLHARARPDQPQHGPQADPRRARRREHRAHQAHRRRARPRPASRSSSATSIEKEFWVKLLGNVSFNPVSALTVSTADRLIAEPGGQGLHGRDHARGARDRPRGRRRRRHRPRGAHRHGARARPVQDLDAAGPRGRQARSRSTACSPARSRSRARPACEAPFTESLFGLIRARAQSTGQYR